MSLSIWDHTVYLPPDTSELWTYPANVPWSVIPWEGSASPVSFVHPSLLVVSQQKAQHANNGSFHRWLRTAFDGRWIDGRHQKPRCLEASWIATIGCKQTTGGVARDLMVVIATTRRSHGNHGGAVFWLVGWCRRGGATPQHHGAPRAAGEYQPGTGRSANAVIPNAGRARCDAFGV